MLKCPCFMKTKQGFPQVKPVIQQWTMNGQLTQILSAVCGAEHSRRLLTRQTAACSSAIKKGNDCPGCSRLRGPQALETLPPIVRNHRLGACIFSLLVVVKKISMISHLNVEG